MQNNGVKPEKHGPVVYLVMATKFMNMITGKGIKNTANYLR